MGVAANAVISYTDADGVQTTLTPSQYTLVITAPTGSQTFGVGGTVTYPKVGSPIASGTSLTISRLVPFTQTTSISNQGNFAPAVIEAALDTLCMEIQQSNARGGAFRGTWATDTDYNFGDIVVDGANGTDTGNYYNCIISNTSDVWATELAAGDWNLMINIQGIADDAADAANSASAAATSATNAATSASSASTSATTATTQASNASTSATNAASSASSASTSATTATTQASNASTSATAAASSATSASASASTATTQASNASTSATNASTSAAAAATSATNAASTFTATSVSSNSIGTGAKTFTTQASKNFVATIPIIAVDSSNAANYIQGTVTSYSGTTLVINGLYTGGSGTITSWNISVSGVKGADGSGSVTSVTFTGDGTVLSSTPSSAVTTSGTVTGTLANAAAKTVLGNATAGSAAPTYTTAPVVSGISTASGFTSTVATGTAPLVVASTTQVANLNAATAGNASTVTTNANLTGVITSSGNATSIASQTGTGTKFVVDTSPTLVTPILGVAAATSIALGGGTALANYLEGTFTPTLLGLGTAGSPTYVNQNGSYTRIGKMVFFSARITISALGSMVGQLAMNGLPLTSGSFLYAVNCWPYSNAAVGVTTAPIPEVQGGTAQIRFYKNAAGTAANLDSATDITATLDIWLNGFYTV